MIGHLTSASVLEPGETYDGGAAALHADAEVAVRIGCDGGIEAYATALELVDLGDDGNAVEIVAANVFHRAVAFGPWRPVSPGDAEGALLVDGAVLARAAAGDDHAEKARAVAALLGAVGEELRPGDRLITGSVVQVAVQPGSRVIAAVGRLGRVELAVAG